MPNRWLRNCRSCSTRNSFPFNNFNFYNRRHQPRQRCPCPFLSFLRVLPPRHTFSTLGLRLWSSLRISGLLSSGRDPLYRRQPTTKSRRELAQCQVPCLRIFPIRSVSPLRKSNFRPRIPRQASASTLSSTTPTLLHRPHPQIALPMQRRRSLPSATGTAAGVRYPFPRNTPSGGDILTATTHRTLAKGYGEKRRRRQLGDRAGGLGASAPET